MEWVLGIRDLGPRDINCRTENQMEKTVEKRGSGLIWGNRI